MTEPLILSPLKIDGDDMRMVVWIILPILLLAGMAGKLSEARVQPNYHVDIFLPLETVPQSILITKDAQCYWQAKIITLQYHSKIIIYDNRSNKNDALAICYLDSDKKWSIRLNSIVYNNLDMMEDIRTYCGNNQGTYDRFTFNGNQCYREADYNNGMDKHKV